MLGTVRPHLGSSTVGIFVVLFSFLCVHVHLVCVAQRPEVSAGCPSRWLSILCLETGVSQWPRAHTRLVCWPGSSRGPLSLPPRAEIKDTYCHAQHVRSTPGVHAQALVLGQQAFTHQSVSTSTDMSEETIEYSFNLTA